MLKCLYDQLALISSHVDEVDLVALISLLIMQHTSLKEGWGNLLNIFYTRIILKQISIIILCACIFAFVNNYAIITIKETMR